MKLYNASGQPVRQSKNIKRRPREMRDERESMDKSLVTASESKPITDYMLATRQKKTGDKAGFQGMDKAIEQSKKDAKKLMDESKFGKLLRENPNPYSKGVPDNKVPRGGKIKVKPKKGKK